MTIIIVEFFAESITEEVGTPNDIRLIESSTTSLTVGWTVRAITLYTNTTGTIPAYLISSKPQIGTMSDIISAMKFEF